MTIELKPERGWSSELPGPPPGRTARSMCEKIVDVADRLRRGLPPFPGPDPPGAIDDVGPVVAPDDDPATPENRLALARRLLIGAIRRYEEVSAEWSDVNESYPNLDPPRHPSGPGEVEERGLWRSLLHHADESFNHAELTLAERIHGLFDMLSPPSRRVAFDPSDYFVPRAVRHGGNLYVLAYSAFEHEPKTNIIAVCRESLVLDLAGETPGPATVHRETARVGSR